MAFAWMLEMLFLTDLGIDIADQDAEAMLEAIRQNRGIAAVFYVLGVLSISIGCVRMLRLPMVDLDTRE